MKNTYTNNTKIYKQIEDLQTGLDVKSGNTYIINHNVVQAYFIAKYGDFYCDNIVSKFNIYNALQADDLLKAVNAYDAEYDPIENYHGIEKRTTVSMYGDETNSREPDSQHNTVTTSAIDGTKTESYTTTDSDTTPRLETRDTSTGGTVTTDDLKTTNTKTRETTEYTSVDGITYEGNDIHSEILEKYGNMGVTMTQQMIEAEKALRLDPVRKNYLDLFIYEYASYSGGCWDGDYI